MMKSKYLRPFAAVLLLTTMFLTTACDRSDSDTVLPGQQQPNNMHDGNGLCIVTTKQPFADESGTRANTDFGGLYKTVFTNGDRIGVIAVIDGAVLDDCNNLLLTYDENGGKWVGDDIFHKTDATYIAYSPYREAMNGKTNVQEIFDAFVVATDQSTADLFAANDLMISANGTVDKAAKTLSFAFEHKLAMLEIDRLHGRTSAEQWLYPIKEASISGCLLNNLPIASPFVNPGEDNAPHRYLVKPVSDASLSINYTINNNYTGISWNVLHQTFVGGQRRRIVPSKKRDIAVGDCYYSDGSIYPGNLIDANTAPPGADKGCIGVVYALGSTGIAAADDIEYYKNTGLAGGGIHGYVTALNSTPPTIWQSGYELMRWPSTNKTEYRGIRNGMREPEKYLPDFVTSPTSSGWYMPSLAQLRAMNKTRNVCETIMKRAGGDGYLHPSAKEYKDGVWIWTNTCRNEQSPGIYNLMWCIWFMGTEPADGDEDAFRTSLDGNKWHSYVAHFCLTF